MLSSATKTRIAAIVCLVLPVLVDRLRHGAPVRFPRSGPTGPDGKGRRSTSWRRVRSGARNHSDRRSRSAAAGHSRPCAAVWYNFAAAHDSRHPRSTAAPAAARISMFQERFIAVPLHPFRFPGPNLVDGLVHQCLPSAHGTRLRIACNCILSYLLSKPRFR